MTAANVTRREFSQGSIILIPQIRLLQKNQKRTLSHLMKGGRGQLMCGTLQSCNPVTLHGCQLPILQKSLPYPTQGVPLVVTTTTCSWAGRGPGPGQSVPQLGKRLHGIASPSDQAAPLSPQTRLLPSSLSFPSLLRPGCPSYSPCLPHQIRLLLQEECKMIPGRPGMHVLFKIIHCMLT